MIAAEVRCLLTSQQVVTASTEFKQPKHEHNVVILHTGTATLIRRLARSDTHCERMFTLQSEQHADDLGSHAAM
jgi:hypothetical protein